MDGIKPKLLLLPNDFHHAKKKLIVEYNCKKHWKYAVHFDSSLPDKNPDDSQMQSFLAKMNKFYDPNTTVSPVGFCLIWRYVALFF